jgi:uncharacterized protein (TIGR02246 family)
MTTAFAHPPAQVEETAIRGLFRRLLDAWGRGDGSAYGALFTDDADYVAFDGSRTIGRPAIAESHQRLFDTWLRGTRLTGRIEAVRFLGPDVALVHATGGTIFAGKTPSVSVTFRISGTRSRRSSRAAGRGWRSWCARRVARAGGRRPPTR